MKFGAFTMCVLIIFLAWLQEWLPMKNRKFWNPGKSSLLCLSKQGTSRCYKFSLEIPKSYTPRLDDSRSPTICLVKSEVVARGPLLFLRKVLFDRALFLKGPHPRLTVNHGLRSSYWPSILTDAYEIKKRTQRYFLRENRMTQSSFSFFIKPFAKNRFQCF